MPGATLAGQVVLQVEVAELVDAPHLAQNAAPLRVAQEGHQPEGQPPRPASHTAHEMGARRPGWTPR